ncbi:TPA: hypothetical protein TXT45_002290 [Streptococcus suis]|nr:hypothetical protein [Streptococcus suis]
MTKKLGVLLVDVPEPRLLKYVCVERVWSKGDYCFDISKINSTEVVKTLASLFTQEEAKKYPQFRWVALEDLE